ncbi:hypothetical protein ACFVH6_20875 [Spirillospora sp. NPDC127200]
MRRRQLAVLGGLMMTAGALVVVAPVSTGVAPAPTTLSLAERVTQVVQTSRTLVGQVRPYPVRSVTMPATGAVPERPYPVRSVI